MNVLVTGASGFIGSALIKELASREIEALGLTTQAQSPKSVAGIRLKLINSYETDGLIDSLSWADVIIHTVAKVHEMDEKGSAELLLSEYKAINCDLALSLAKKAAENGVKRFIYFSSIKVNGEFSPNDTMFSELSPPNFVGPYAESKWMAERALLNLAENSNLQVTIIRPPLVYAKGVKGNLDRLITWTQKDRFIILPAIENRRSLIGLANLVDFTLMCTDYNLTPQAKNQVYLISDIELSTYALFESLVRIQGADSRIVCLPLFLSKVINFILKNNPVYRRLFGSLILSSNKANEELGWKPKYTPEEQFEEMLISHKVHN